MFRRATAFVFVSALVLGACGGGSASSKALPASDTPPTTVARQAAAHLYRPAGPNPSKSAKMICADEARADIESSLEVKATSVTKPTWHDHVYSCAYVYPQGRIVVSVKELVNAATTTTYYDAILQKYGVTERLVGLGQAAWLLRNDDVATRKDYKVLLVDVQGIPTQFTPKVSRADVARTVATVIMGCWSGA